MIFNQCKIQHLTIQLNNAMAYVKYGTIGSDNLKENENQILCTKISFFLRFQTVQVLIVMQRKTGESHLRDVLKQNFILNL